MILAEAALSPVATAVASLLTALGAALAPAPPVLVAPAGSSTAADSPAVVVEAPAPEWRSPLEGLLLVLDPFDPPAQDWLPGHRGVDLLAFPGDVVRAAGAGMVVFAGPVAGRGVVTVLHRDGRTTTYEPVSPAVGVGDDVEAGQPLGLLHEGAGHCGEVPSCLHWGLRDGDAYLDPMTLLRPGRPSLLPLTP